MVDKEKLEIESIKEGMAHAENEFRKIGDVGDPIRFKLIAQFAASKAIEFYKSHLK